ncbi:MAG: hypothetical protein ACHBN1_08780 [Heteroscytonema crispum UTEX LB 1556]
MTNNEGFMRIAIVRCGFVADYFKTLLIHPELLMGVMDRKARSRG